MYASGGWMAIRVLSTLNGSESESEPLKLGSPYHVICLPQADISRSVPEAAGYLVPVAKNVGCL